jgi:hypothetical protein
MEVKKQFTVALENVPGALASLCTKLAKKGVNIEAISVINTQEMGFVRILVSDVQLASEALKQYNSAKEDVLVLSIPNSPGELGKTAQKLSENNVNIEYTYGSASGQGDSRLILKVSDIAEAQKALS